MGHHGSVITSAVVPQTIMAIIDKMPEKAIISGCAGILDFYVLGCTTDHPITCVRSWPRYNPSAYPQTTIDARPPFAYTNSVLKSLPANLRAAYAEMAGGSSLTWRDMVTRCYLNGDLV